MLQYSSDVVCRATNQYSIRINTGRGHDVTKEGNAVASENHRAND